MELCFKYDDFIYEILLFDIIYNKLPKYNIIYYWSDNYKSKPFMKNIFYFHM
jgi:hypothetical protein